MKEFFDNLFYEAMRKALSDFQGYMIGGSPQRYNSPEYKYAVVKKENYFPEIIRRFYTINAAIEFCTTHKKNYRNRNFSLRIIKIDGE